MPDYYNRAGQPITDKQWHAFYGDRDYKLVQYDEDELGSVSTVWLGLDHQWGDGPPLIFETLVFNGALDGEMNRYSTEEEARAGHALMVERVKALAE